VGTIGIQAWGLILMAGNIIGGVGGGFLIDVFVRRYQDGHMRAILLGLIVAGPSYIAFPQAPSAGLALLILTPAALGSGLLQACGAASLMGVTPSGMRGKISAVYFFAINTIGVGVGPTAVALLTDYVFKSPNLIRHSLTTIAVFATLSGIAAALVARRAYVRMAAAISLDREAPEQP
jgi:MFS family permease